MAKIKSMSGHIIHFSLMLSIAGSAYSKEISASQKPTKSDISTNPIIRDVVKQISTAKVESYVKKLVSFGTRHTMSETESETRGIGAARRWIKSELESCSKGRLDVQFDSHVAPEGRRLNRATEIVNVVATLKGKNDPDRMYVVSGHYDSRVTDVMDAKSDAPGANDDASGTAAVMEMACVMSQYDFDASIVFMAVAAEEQGLLGAAHWAQKAKENNWNVAGMFTNDIIGSSRAEDGSVDNKTVRLFAEGIPALKENSEANRNLIATGGENDSPSRQLARHVKEIGERYVKDFKVNIIYRRDRYLRGGDHIPFLERGFAALRFTEPNEDYRHQHQDLRSENGVKFGDLPEFVDFDYTAKVARVNAAALASLALAPAAPSNAIMKTAQLENDTVVTWNANRDHDLAGYRIVWRDTTSALWQGSIEVGNVTEYRIKGKSKDNYFFGVQAIDKAGNVSVASYPMPGK
ncbi:M28 family metallopeptidase [Undibacterium cyanobacteriorum]|uniref:M28 family metallopeptidase n=1 Tax=Undibacterium cyanobacteriorum TaxID=3073561 RepID=A0ABY9RJB2_9BURK|nr:M28 family metallopeptidase [Undibacterium sp. 20NA77.5]WMW81016.1 M28 family metallopeptidase [Undibacterium sp. 20NA77.5]